VYGIGCRLAGIAPLESGFYVERLGVSARLVVPDGPAQAELTFFVDTPSDEWNVQAPLLAQLDAEAERVVAVLCFRYVVTFIPPYRRYPTDMSFYDLAYEFLVDEQPVVDDALPSALSQDDPRVYPCVRYSKS